MAHIEGIKRMIDRQQDEARKHEEQKRKEAAALFLERSRVHLIITGAVQGVFFRSFVETTARGLELTGWVENKVDGTVELIAEGEKGALEQLVAACTTGPPKAKVTDVKTVWSSFEGEFASFTVRD